MATYYVKNGGNNALDGLSIDNAWETIAKVNSVSFSPGDIIKFAKGSVWRETLEIPTSGTSGSYIKFTSYVSGSEANPQILGSAATTTWTDQGSNKWKSDITFTNPYSLYPYYADIAFTNGDGSQRFGSHKANTASLAAEYDWTWVSNYIYVYAATDPGSRYSGIEVPQRRFGVSTNDNQYLNFDGLDVFYCADIGYDTNSDHGDHTHIHGCILENSTIGFVGGIGTVGDTATQVGYGVALNYSDLIIRNCEIHHSGRRNISLDIYGDGFTQVNALIEDNYIHDGFHTTGVDINVGAGGSYTANWDGVIIRRNNIYEPTSATIPSNQIFIQNSNRGTTTINNIYIYSNIFSYPSFAAINMEGSQSVYVYNNTFFEVGSITSNAGYQLWIDANNDSVKVKNNIFYCTSSVRTNGHGAAIYCASTYANCDIDYNIYYRINNTLDMIIAGSTYYMNTAFPISGKGWEAHGKKADPLFVSSSDLHLQESSPAIASGVHLDAVELGFDSFPFDATTPAMGAYEYDSGALTAAISESLSLESTQAAIFTALASQVESLALADTKSAISTRLADITESLSMVDTPTAISILNSIIAEAMSLEEVSDADVNTSPISADITELLSLFDTINANISQSQAFIWKDTQWKTILAFKWNGSTWQPHKFQAYN